MSASRAGIERSGLAATILAGLSSQHALATLGLELIEASRHAILLREIEGLKAISTAILDLPLPDGLRSIGEFYRIKATPDADPGFRRAALSKIAAAAPPGFVSRVVVDIGVSYRRAGDLVTASQHFVEAAAMSRGSNLLEYCQAQRYLSICESCSGDHRAALARLEAMARPMALVRGRYPTEFLDYLNSVAVELAFAGRIDEARGAIAIPLASSIAPRYFEWAETQQEIEEAAASGRTPPPLVFALGSVETIALTRSEALEGPEKARALTQDAQTAQQLTPVWKRRRVPLFRFSPGAALARGRFSLNRSKRQNPHLQRALYFLIRSKPARAPPLYIR